jgi:hypothetical protein
MENPPARSVDAKLRRQVAIIFLVALILVAVVVGCFLLSNPFATSPASSSPTSSAPAPAPTPSVVARTPAAAPVTSPAIERAERRLARLKSRLRTKADAGREAEESEAKESAKRIAIAMELYEARHEGFPESPGELRKLGVPLPPHLEAFGVGVSGYIVRVGIKGGGWYTVEGGEEGGKRLSCSNPGEGECPASGRWN